MKEILVIALARLGDLVQCFPAISDLGRLPEVNGVDVLVQKDLLPLAKLHPGIRRVIPFAGDDLLSAIQHDTDWIEQGMPLVDELLSTLENPRPDVIVNLTHTAFSGKLSGILPSREVRGRSFQPETETILADRWSRYFFTLLESRSCNAFNLTDIHRDIAGGIRGLCEKPHLPQRALKYAAEKLRTFRRRPLIALGIGAHHVLRRWPVEEWRRTAVELQRSCRADIVLVGDASDRGAAEAVAEPLGKHALNLCGLTDVEQLSAILDRCDLFLGHDSGPLHLAATLQKPCVGLYFAMASAWETAPYVSRGITIEPDLPCYPCSEEGRCPDPKCHRVVTPEAVAATAKLALRGEIPELRSDCIIRITDFDPEYRLVLDGSRKEGDEKRLFWGGILPAVLNTDATFDKDNLSLYVYGHFQRHWEWDLQQLKHSVLTSVQRTLTDLQISPKTGMPEDPLLQNHPSLTAEYPIFRPLLDLYKVDCLAGDGKAVTALERILAAQDRLLQRISIVEEVLTSDLKSRIAQAMDQFEKVTVEPPLTPVL